MGKKAAKNADGLPRFMKNGNATGTPASTPPDDEPGLPRFLRKDADQTQIIGHLLGTADFSPAMMQHDPPNDKSESREPEVLAKRARNLRDLARQGDVIATTPHSELE